MTKLVQQLKLSEVSLCGKGMNPGAVISLFKSMPEGTNNIEKASLFIERLKEAQERQEKDTALNGFDLLISVLGHSFY